VKKAEKHYPNEIRTCKAAADSQFPDSPRAFFAMTKEKT
jgi:hypothetical protein